MRLPFLLSAMGALSLLAAQKLDFRDAVRAGDEPAVRDIVRTAPDLNARDALGAAALHDAVWTGRIEMVRLLLDLGSDPNITHSEADSTPLHYAAIKNEVAIAQLLIERGASVRAASSTGATALHLAAGRGYTGLARLLLAHGAEIDAPDRSGSTPLEEASWKGFAETCALLLDHGAKVNFRNPLTSSTPLNEAAAKGRLPVVQLLLARGADASVADKNGATPLRNAARFRHEDVMRELLANRPAASLDGALLGDAVLSGETEVARMLILQGADVNALGTSGSTPLHEAALKGREELARLLIEKGARVNVMNRFGSTPLHDAALSGDQHIVALLLAHGAQVNVRDRDGGETPLYNAASMGHLETIQLLVSQGADVNLCTSAGSSPLHAALENGFQDVADFLRRNGALDRPKVRKSYQP